MPHFVENRVRAFVDEVAGREADHETNDHACKDGYDRFMCWPYSVHLEVIRRRQREVRQHIDDRR